VVAQFLELSPDQVEAFLHLLRMRQEAVTPLRMGIAERERQLQELLGSGNPDPQLVGQLVIEIHQLRQLIARAQAHFLAQFENLLNEEQERRWQQAQFAERLQPILPAFRLLHLL
jgi:Spy/CpxP family protein refolding chaperone